MDYPENEFEQMSRPLSRADLREHDEAVVPALNLKKPIDFRTVTEEDYKQDLT